MGVKVTFVLALVLCLCTFGYSTPVVKKCQKLVNGAFVEEDCDDGTGVSSVPGQPDNVFVGFDVQGRRVFKIAGNDTCFIDTDPAALPNYVKEATVEQTKTAVLVTDQAVLDSVSQWCTGDVYLLVARDTAVTGDRRKRATCYRLICRYYLIGGTWYRYCWWYLYTC